MNYGIWRHAGSPLDAGGYVHMRLIGQGVRCLICVCVCAHELCCLLTYQRSLRPPDQTHTRLRLSRCVLSTQTNRNTAINPNRASSDRVSTVCVCVCVMLCLFRHANYVNIWHNCACVRAFCLSPAFVNTVRKYYVPGNRKTHVLPLVLAARCVCVSVVCVCVLCGCVCKCGCVCTTSVTFKTLRLGEQHQSHFDRWSRAGRIPFVGYSTLYVRLCVCECVHTNARRTAADADANAVFKTKRRRTR